MFWLAKFFTKGKTVKDGIKYFHTINGRMPNNLEIIKIKNAFMEQNRPSNVIDMTSRLKDEWWKTRSGFKRQHPEVTKKVDEDPTSAMYDRHIKEIEGIDKGQGMGFYREMGDIMKKHRREELELEYHEMFNKILEKAKRIETDPKVLLEAELGKKLTGKETTTQLLDLFSKRPKKASGGIARVGMFTGGPIQKGAAWVIKNLKKSVKEVDQGKGPFSKLNPMQQGLLKKELNTLIKQLERGGPIPDEMLTTMRQDPRFKDVVKRPSTDPELREIEEVLLDHQATKQAEQIVDDVFGKGHPENQQIDMLEKFDVTGKTKHASGGIAGQLHLNRPGYGGGKLVLDSLLKLLKGKKKDLRGVTGLYKHIDMEKLMKGKEPITVYSGSMKRPSNTWQSFKETAKDLGTTPEKIAKDNFKDQWFTPFKSYADAFSSPEYLESKLRSVDLTPKEIGMAKRYVEKINKTHLLASMRKKLGIDKGPLHSVTTDDNLVLIPRYKLKELEKSGRMKTDYMILEKLKKKMGLAEGGIAGELHLNQGGRAKFQDGALAAYQTGQNIIGAPVETQTAQEEISWEPGQAAPEGYEVKRAYGDEWIERVKPSMPPVGPVEGMMPPVGPVELPPGILGLMEPSMALSVPPPAGTSIDGRVITQEDIDTYNFTKNRKEEAERLTEMQARGIDPRMARSYQENIRLMGDPRMQPPMPIMPMGGTPIDVMPPPSDPYEGLSGQEYAEKHNIPYAKGGRIGFTGGTGGNTYQDFLADKTVRPHPDDKSWRDVFYRWLDKQRSNQAKGGLAKVLGV